MAAYLARHGRDHDAYSDHVFGAESKGDTQTQSPSPQADGFGFKVNVVSPGTTAAQIAAAQTQAQVQAQASPTTQGKQTVPSLRIDSASAIAAGGGDTLVLDSARSTTPTSTTTSTNTTTNTTSTGLLQPPLSGREQKGKPARRSVSFSDDDGKGAANAATLNTNTNASTTTTTTTSGTSYSDDHELMARLQQQVSALQKRLEEEQRTSQQLRASLEAAAVAKS